jgi:ATP-dependent Clp protease protease subunit
MKMHKYRNERTAKSISAYWGKPLKDREWYSVDTSSGQSEVLIYDVIGWPYVDAGEFTREFKSIKSKEITVGINSPGGDVFDGTAIYNVIKDHPAKVTTRIDGVAASMASIIALAGDEIQIASNAYYMIHNPWSMAIGDYRDFENESGLLRRIANTLAETYSERTGQKLDAVQQMMDNETWIIGKELVEQGFADKVIGEGKKASFDLSMYANTPKDIKSETVKTPVKTERELEQVLTRDAGLSRSQAKAIIKSGFKPLEDTQDAVNSDIEALTNLIKSLGGHHA